MKEKQFTKIGIELPEGYKPSRFEVVGNMLNVYLYEEKTKWEINEIIYKSNDTK